MWSIEERFAVKLGGNYYINTPNLIQYKGDPLFEIKRGTESGVLGISFKIYDSDGNSVASVKEGRIYTGDASKYDVVSPPGRYTLIEKATGIVLCDIRKQNPKTGVELDVSVNLYTKDGFLIQLTPTHTNIGGVSMTNSTFENCGVGIGIN